MIEIGLILKDYGCPIALVLGNETSVEFPIEKLLEVHLKNPCDWRLIHTHPDGYSEFSKPDWEVMKAVAMSISPYSLFFTIICGEIIRTKYCWWNRVTGFKVYED